MSDGITSIEYAFLHSMNSEIARETNPNADRKTLELQVRRETDVQSRRWNDTSEADKPNFEPAVMQNFFTALRNAGIPASTSEFLDLQTILNLGMINSLNDLYTAGRSLLIKNSACFPIYDRVFAITFGSIIGVEVDNKGNIKESEPEKKADQEVFAGQEKPKEENQSKEVSAPGNKETKHGGKDAHKAIDKSPAAVEGGLQEANKLQQSGKKGKNKSEKGSGNGKESKNNTTSGKTDKKPGIHENAGVDGKKETHRGGRGKPDYRSLEHSQNRLKDNLLHPEQVKDLRWQLNTGDRIAEAQFEQVFARLMSLFNRESSTENEELDVEATVEAIARNGGLPELIFKEEKEKKPRLILLIDYGGSTDMFLNKIVSIFRAARDVFQELDVYYFHNAIYGEVSKQPNREYLSNIGNGQHKRMSEILSKDSASKVIIIGDQKMAINTDGFGALYDTANTFNDNVSGGLYDKTGFDNFQAVVDRFPDTVWITPLSLKEQKRIIDFEEDNDRSPGCSIVDLQKIFRTYELTPQGLENAVRTLME